MQMSGAGGAPQAQPWREGMFRRADADRSGAISLEEFTRAAARRREAAAVDSAAPAANTAQPGRAEVSIQAMFDRLDSNADGALSRAELAALGATPGQLQRLDSATFSALLNTQGRESGTARATRQTPIVTAQSPNPRASRREGEQNDAPLPRQLAAYQARQPAPQGTTPAA